MGIILAIAMYCDCNCIADKAQEVMRERQNGALYSEMIREDKLEQRMVEEAFERERYYKEGIQEIVINDFKNKWRLQCWREQLWK